MKTFKELFVLTVLFVIPMLLNLSGCEEAEDNYNYDNIEPRLVGGISGPKEAVASGFNEYKYKVIHRGGSDYSWSVDKDEYVASLKQNSDYPNEAYIQYAELHDTSIIEITVEETTMGGETTSTTDSVKLLPYCPYPVENYIGYYTSSNTSDVADTVYIDTTNTPNQLRVYGLADFITNPGRWNENWILGDGSCTIDLFCKNLVKIEKQWIGDSDYPSTYYIEGSGTIDTTTNVITLFYNILYDDTGTKTVSTALTHISE